MVKKQNWIIGIGGSDIDDVVTYRVFGTKTQVKKELVRLVKEEKRNNDADDWEHGTTKIADIEEVSPDHLYTYACFRDFHVDFSAEAEKEPREL